MKTLIIILLIYLLCKKKDALGGLIRGATRLVALVGRFFVGLFDGIVTFYCRVSMEYKCAMAPQSADETREIWASWLLRRNNKDKWEAQFDDSTARYVAFEKFTGQPWVDFCAPTCAGDGMDILAIMTIVIGTVFFLPIILIALL